LYMRKVKTPLTVLPLLLNVAIISTTVLSLEFVITLRLKLATGKKSSSSIYDGVLVLRKPCCIWRRHGQDGFVEDGGKCETFVHLSDWIVGIRLVVFFFIWISSLQYSVLETHELW